MHVGAMMNYKSNNTSKVASSAKKGILSGALGEATNSKVLKNTLVPF
jgi:hypothetical protein